MVHAELEIKSFLKGRRAALDPAELGLPEGLIRRRVRGLRREEVAQLAGISVDYYTRIEQGRAPAISDSVLAAVGRALRLSPDEVNYLHNVSGRRRGAGTHSACGTGAGAEADGARAADGTDGAGGPGDICGREPVQRVRPEIRQVLDALDTTVPAFIYGRCLDILAWNTLAARVSFDLDAVPDRRRNSALLLFFDPAAKELHPDWERLAAETVANLRADAGRHADDPRTCEVVGELHDRSAEFRRLWQAQGVRERCNGIKRILHPVVGELVVSYETFRLPTDPDQVLCTYTAERGSATARALSRLAAPIPAA
ncbi:helix-turn-helix domain-containing protein [Streptomyces sp. H27-D2]|uniref:helix-turn-helix domain-containing protein n=1 Tax=Streptomyces sp. H27-D2 TaxID=3046304 RepID=UPI002DBA8214|nr:helix-turn-helix transcriptional regulator [Streptomyces sp. H27-D2]MEC4015650.1 helix-turn-helix transcriptional regulator [Streptomyces sp. H27-D2]